MLFSPFIVTNIAFFVGKETHVRKKFICDLAQSIERVTCTAKKLNHSLSVHHFDSYRYVYHVKFVTSRAELT